MIKTDDLSKQNKNGKNITLGGIVFFSIKFGHPKRKEKKRRKENEEL